MKIQELIEANERQIALLQKHNAQLRQMDAELGGQASLKPRRVRGPNANGPTAKIEKFLREHPGPQAAREIAAQLDCATSDVHGMIRNGLQSGRFVRTDPGTYTLGPQALRDVSKAAP